MQNIHCCFFKSFFFYEVLAGTQVGTAADHFPPF